MPSTKTAWRDRACVATLSFAQTPEVTGAHGKARPVGTPEGAMDLAPWESRKRDSLEPVTDYSRKDSRGLLQVCSRARPAPSMQSIAPTKALAARALAGK